MRDKWSLLVVTTVSGTSIHQSVLDFGSSNWADVAYDRITETDLNPSIRITVIKLY